MNLLLQNGHPLPPEQTRGAAPVVLIGPVSDDPSESVSSVNRAFIESLAGRYAFVPLPARRTYGNTRQARLNSTNAFYFLHQLTQWGTRLIRHRPAIVHYAISVGWAMEKGLVFTKLARRLGAKTLGHLHSGGFFDHWTGIPAWRKRLALAELKRLDGLVVLSEFWREQIVTHVGLPREKVFVVNNPIDPNFEPAALQMPIQRPQNVILTLGALCKDKGVLDTLEAAKLARTHSPFKIQLVGPEREPGIHKRIRDFVANNSLADCVELKSGAFGKEKIKLFQEASIFLLPSYYENFPLVVLEAAAAGHAIITTPVGATPEFFKDGVSALFVTPGNPSQIAEAVRRLLQHPEERLRLGKAARAVFTSRLARSTVMSSLEQAYAKILQSNGH